MAGNVKELTTADFDSATASGVSLIDFWAPWCGPCRMQGPIVEKLADELEGVMIAKVNVDEAPEVAAKFGIRSIPTLIVMKDGAAVETFVGLRKADELKSVLAKHSS